MIRPNTKGRKSGSEMINGKYRKVTYHEQAKDICYTSSGECYFRFEGNIYVPKLNGQGRRATSTSKWVKMTELSSWRQQNGLSDALVGPSKNCGDIYSFYYAKVG